MTLIDIKRDIAKMQRAFYSLNKVEKEFCEEVKIPFYKLKKDNLVKLHDRILPKYSELLAAQTARENLKAKLEKEASEVPDAEPGEGYKELLKLVEADSTGGDGIRYKKHFDWIIKRAKHYQLVSGIPYQEILTKWMEKMNYWYINYFQDANQPLIIVSGDFKVFENKEEAKNSFKGKGFRCPACGEISTDPNACNSGHKDEKGKVCDWKAYGLFGTLGKGATIFIKDILQVVDIFMPIAWEEQKGDKNK